MLQSESVRDDGVRVSRWYGFGRQHQLYQQTFAFSDAPSLNFTATLSSSAVTPVDLGEFQQGQITFTSRGVGANVNTHVHVFDADLRPIPGFQSTGGPAGTSGAILTREYEPGTYFFVYGLRTVSTDQPTPADTPQRNVNVTDFPNLVIGGQTGVNSDLTFQVIDSTGTATFPLTQTVPHQVHFAQFTVVPEPATAGLVVAAGLLVLRRRR